MELVTGYRGTNHVTAEQLADLQAGIIGYDACILNIGEKLKADVITSNKIRIFDGVFVFHGKEAIIEAGDYQDITIENGTIGLYRNDIIAVEYKKDEGTGVENTTLKVIKGATASTAKDPVTSTNDVRAGAFESEIALYRVKLNGLAIEKVEPLCKVCDNISSLKSYFAKSMAEINSRLTTYGGVAAKGVKFNNDTYYIVKNGICFAMAEVTPLSAVAHGDIFCSGLPKPTSSITLSIPAANGNYSAVLDINGAISIYFPIFTAPERVDFSFCYPIK